MDASLKPFFEARGIVVLGASTQQDKLGFGVARNLVQSRYPGKIHFVNPKGGNLFGRMIYTDLSEVPDPLDLAVIVVPAPAVPETLRQCGERGIRAAIIISGGFRETGPAGAALEEKCVQIARQYQMRFIGPNCVGLIDTNFPLDTTFLQTPTPPPGEVALLSHSGAICAALIDWSRGQGFSFSRLISLGNQADVNETDMLIPLAEDPKTRVIGLYLEHIGSGRDFVRVAAQIARHKPIVALKSGRFSAGQKAAASHTGALAGSDTAYQAAFEKAGVLRVANAEEMFDWSHALAWCPLPKGPRTAILTNAGGPGVIAADGVEQHGLQLAELSPQTVAALTDLLPPAASKNNPVDMIASGGPKEYEACLRLLLADPQVDSVLVLSVPPPMYPASQVAERLISVIQASEKPVLIAFTGGQLVEEAVEMFRKAHIPAYPFPERAASALACLARRAEFLKQPEVTYLPLEDADREKAHQLLAESPAGSWLDPEACSRLMDTYRIPNAAVRLARAPEEAAELATQMGFPVVLKVASPDLPHKSDVGGVLLNLRTKEEVISGYTQIVWKVRAVEPQAFIEGVHVQRMTPPGQEVIVGAVRDAQFGPLVMFGSGGVEVEGLRDVAFALAPLNQAEAEKLIRRTWAGKKLQGFRSIPPGDEAAVADVLVRLSHLAYDCQEISEIEINPLRVLSPAAGAIALDVRARK